MRLVLCAVLIVAPILAQDYQGWLDRGIQEFKASKYPNAAGAFQKAVDLDPSAVEARLFLGRSLMAQYLPGAEIARNADIFRLAQDQFTRVLQSDANNVTALKLLAALEFEAGQTTRDPQEKLQRLDEASSWYQRLVQGDPLNKEAYYLLGVIDWTKWYPVFTAARQQLGMRPEVPGPLSDAALRQKLREQYGALIEDGIENLRKALEIDVNFDDAMAYMNLFVRERADLRDTSEEYRQDIATADALVTKALDTRRRTQAVEASRGHSAELQTMADQAELLAPPSPPPPPPPPPTPPPSSSGAKQIRVNGNVQAANLIRKVEPLYPPLAKQARVQGTVRLSVVIDRDGRVANIQLISGHPLLIEAARQAVQHWEYRPTLLNGAPVDVVTSVDVDFTLPN